MAGAGDVARKALSGQSGARRLYGFNSARYSMLSKPAAGKKPPSPSHR